jgi:hypothetical protein
MALMLPEVLGVLEDIPEMVEMEQPSQADFVIMDILL